MKLRGFDITNAQRGWVCDCCFTVTTADQFTGEEHTVRSGARWIWLAMYRSWRKARAHAADLQASPGEREAKGWTGQREIAREK